MGRSIFVVAYDVSDDKRRNRISRELLKYGVRAQYSVFEVFVSEKEFKQMKKQLQKFIDRYEDSLVFYPLTENEYKNAKREGNKLSFGHLNDIYV